MPVTKSALKALRRDKRRTLANRSTRVKYRTALKEARSKKTPQAVVKAYSALDRAAKTGVIHANKAARLKSRLMKLVATKTPTAKPANKVKKAKKTKKTSKKTAKK